MLYTLEGGARGGLYDPKKEQFEEAQRKLRRDGVSYVQPFFDEAEQRHPGPTKNLNKRTKELKGKTVEVMRERLKPLMGDVYVDELKLVKKVTLVQIEKMLPNRSAEGGGGAREEAEGGGESKGKKGEGGGGTKKDHEQGRAEEGRSQKGE